MGSWIKISTLVSCIKILLTFWEAFKSSLGKWSNTKKKRLPTSCLTRAQKPLRSKLTMTDQKFKVKVAFMEARLGQTTKKQN